MAPWSSLEFYEHLEIFYLWSIHMKFSYILLSAYIQVCHPSAHHLSSTPVAHTDSNHTIGSFDDQPSPSACTVVCEPCVKRCMYCDFPYVSLSHHVTTYYVLWINLLKATVRRTPVAYYAAISIFFSFCPMCAILFIAANKTSAATSWTNGT